MFNIFVSFLFFLFEEIITEGIPFEAYTAFYVH